MVAGISKVPLAIHYEANGMLEFNFPPRKGFL